MQGLLQIPLISRNNRFEENHIVVKDVLFIQKALVTVLVIAGAVFGFNTDAFAENYILDGVSLEEETDEYLNYLADKEFSNMPYNVTSKFTAAGWDYVVLKKGEINKFYKAQGDWYYDGMVDHDLHIIFIDGDMRSMPVLYHEMGHFIDQYYGKLCETFKDQSSKQPFLEIYNEERYNLDKYSSQSPDEFFADVVMGIYDDPEETAKKAPRSYEYVTNYISKF